MPVSLGIEVVMTFQIISSVSANCCIIPESSLGANANILLLMGMIWAIFRSYRNPYARSI